MERKYSCAKCDAAVVSNRKDNGLGTWHCTKNCSDPTKVKVTLKKGE